MQPRSPGDRLGKYVVESLIAKHGGGGAVYRARHFEHGRLIALKHLPPPETVAEAARYEREMKFAMELEHPHIVPVYDVDRLPPDGDRLIAMRLVNGKDLATLRDESRVLPTRAVAMVEQMAGALDYAHGRGIVHRDVKPQNAMADGDFVYLMDFGTARGAADLTVTAPNTVVGTLAYMSPEQIDGQPATRLSDVYALTGVLYTLLTGRLPYPTDDPRSIMFAHVGKPPPRASDIRPELSPFDAVIARGMAKTPSDRYPSAPALAAQARAALAEASGDDAPSTKRTRERSRPVGAGATAPTQGLVATLATKRLPAVLDGRGVAVVAGAIFGLTLLAVVLLKFLAT